LGTNKKYSVLTDKFKFALNAYVRSGEATSAHAREAARKVDALSVVLAKSAEAFVYISFAMFSIEAIRTRAPAIDNHNIFTLRVQTVSQLVRA